MMQRIFLKRSLFTTLFFLLLFCNTYAQFSINGNVIDARSGEKLIGATLTIEGTSIATASDIDGNFTLKNIPNGKHTLVCSYITYQTQRIPVDEQTPLPIAISLTEDNLTLQEVTITTKRRQDTETAMLQGVRSTLSVASGISAGQIARTGDTNAAEIIRRVPGVSILDDRYIVIRGLAQRYNKVWINGGSAPSVENDSRVFSFDMLPSGQIDNMMIYKSPSPELPGEFAGGFIKIATKNRPLRNRLQVTYTTGFNTATHFRDTRMNPGSSTDWLGFDQSKRQLSNDFPQHLDIVSTDPDRLTQLTRYGMNRDWSIQQYRPMPDQKFNIDAEFIVPTDNEMEISNATALSYSNVYKTITDMTNIRYGIYSVATDQPIYLDNYIDNQYTNEVKVGLMHNWLFRFNKRHSIEFHNLLNIFSKNRLTERSGIKDISSPYYREQTEMLYQSRLSYAGQLSGKHYIDNQSRHSLDWTLAYNYAFRDEPDRRIVTNQSGISDTNDISHIVTGNDNITRYYQSLSDHIGSLAFNYRGEISLWGYAPIIKAGLFTEYSTRDYRPREFLYRYDKLTYEERNEYLYLPFEQMMTDQWLSADKVYLDEVTKKTNAYQASNFLGAAYAAFEFPLDKINIHAGARLEYNNMRLTRDRSMDPASSLISHHNYINLDILPSVNVTYDINDRHLLRFAYGMSLNRPEFREVSPAVYYDFDLFNEIGGNENLESCKIQNVDLRYEFYPASNEVISAGLFFKYFDKPIEWTYTDMGGSLRYNYQNAISASCFGAEIELRKTLDFIGMKGFTLLLNASVIASNVTFDDSGIIKQENRPMQGQSPYIINAALFYNNKKYGWEASLQYNRVGKRIIGIGKANNSTGDESTNIPDTYELPRNSLDLTVSKTFGKFVIKLGAKDILCEKITYAQYPEFDLNGTHQTRTQITKSYRPGTSISIGVAYKIL